MIDRFSAYMPIDRRHAVAAGEPLPERMHGAALFADISGFTPLTETLARELGHKRGAEELTMHLNRVYDALIATLHRFGGSVIGFSGDAITCWLEQDDGRRATACALAMQSAMMQFAAVQTRSGTVITLGMKAALVAGSVRRFCVGDPDYGIVDVIAGVTLERLAATEAWAERGEVVLDATTATTLADLLIVSEWRGDGACAVVSGVNADIAEAPWPPLEDVLSAEITRAWLLPPVYERLAHGMGDFLAELRPAVALFLKFTGIDYEHDADSPQKLDRFIRQVQQVLTDYDGSLIQLTVGDKGSYLYAVFGAPIAHEDDAERACSAALTLDALVAGLDYLTEVQIGIAFGRMRTGAYGSTTRRTYGVLGDATNLAARLMTVAQPGQILVSDTIVSQTKDAFAWEQLAPMTVKGKSQPIDVSCLLGVLTQTQASLHKSLYKLPMVGRAEELAQAKRIVAAAVAGRGQIVGISAEAGMGKSRLAAEIVRIARAAGLEVFGGECQSYGFNSSYLVWRDVWWHLLGLEAGSSKEAIVGHLQALLASIDPVLAGRLPLLGALLHVAIEENHLTRSLSPKVRKTALESLCVALLQALAPERALVIVLEDTHWIDPLSADLLVEIGRAVADLPILLLTMYRPPQPVAAIDVMPHFSEIQLREFSPEEAAQLIDIKLGGYFDPTTTGPTTFVQRVTEQASGNPFYIEELLNFLQDMRIDPHDEAALAKVDLPPTLYSLVLSRVDRLSEDEQIVLKVASVIGRMFQASMLWGVHPDAGDFDQLLRRLDALRTLDLTQLDAPEPDFVYLFKHVITQQVAYESLLYATRSRLHRAIGGYIERTHADALDQFVDLLAHHYGHSDDEAKQRLYFVKAGNAAQAAYANLAAINYYERALPLLDGREAIDVRLQLGAILELTGDRDGAGELYETALTASVANGDRDAEAWCRTSIGELMRKRSQYDEAAEWLAQARDTFLAIDNQVGVGRVMHIGGTLAAQQGDFETAKRRYVESMEIRRALGDRENEANVLNNLGIVARWQNDLDAARTYQEASLAIHEEMGNRWSIGAQLNNLALLAIDDKKYDYARRQLERALLIWREIGERWATANTIHNLANVSRDEGDLAGALATYADAARRWMELDDRWGLAYWLEDVALLWVADGDFERAIKLVAVADRLHEEIGSPRPPKYAVKIDTALKPAATAFSAHNQTALIAAGRSLSLQDAVALALQ